MAVMIEWYLIGLLFMAASVAGFYGLNWIASRIDDFDSKKFGCPSPFIICILAASGLLGILWVFMFVCVVACILVFSGIWIFQRAKKSEKTHWFFKPICRD